ncbi:MAG: BREX-1 system phosphatase PglZ type A [Nitrospiraceae bacterium]|nr:BREX-1 system phosphatase PglZ type A [Nitrospiraceae bacterium]
MDTRQIHDTLYRMYKEEGARIVFWNDPDKEFQTILPALNLDGVNIIQLNELGALEVKIRVEREDPTGWYLLYSPGEEPDYENDWLLDVRLYSRNFRADRASILLNELGLKNLHLRQHLADRRKFFDNKERLQKLKSLVEPNDIASDLDRKMIATVVKAEQPEWFNIIRTLYHAYTDNGDEIDFQTEPAAWEQIEKFELDKPFWEMAKTTFGYSEETPTLKNLLLRLFVTDYVHHLKAAPPSALLHLILPTQGRSNAVVCLGQWRDSSSKGSSYDRLSEEVAALIHLEDYLLGLEIPDLLDVMTFLVVERGIASRLRERVHQTADMINPDEVQSIATRRQAGHWASLMVNGSSVVPRRALHAVYDALVAAADFFALRNQHRDGFVFPDATALYRAYEEKLFRFDQLYRHFCEAADHAEAQGWNILKPLRELIEDCYSNWYLSTLALAWGKFLDPQGTAQLLTKWQLDQIPNQQEFFNRQVRPRLEEAEKRKAYVIISDAFRYEAAQELTQELNGTYRFEATLASQLGVVPSYTALGMASLLPHQTLSFKPNGDILVDGKPTSSTEQRGAILEGVEGMACKADELVAMKKEQGREFVAGKRVVYIYHNVVDAIGDAAATEEKTFQGVRKAIEELAALVTYIINNLNGNHILITADHGFLFTESPPGQPDKTKLDQKPEGTVRAKKRYVIGRQLPDNDYVWHGKTSDTACAEGEMEYWIPKAGNRFHFTGGARFIHGGAMLQEIAVPVITVKHRKDKSTREETKVKSVTVHVLGASHKVTTNRHRFELIQAEPVSERVKPITLKVAIYEGDNAVTNVETVTFDSASDKMDERKKWVHVVLQDHQYHKNTAYRLVLRDADTGIEQQSVPVTIDRVFADDF